MKDWTERLNVKRILYEMLKLHFEILYTHVHSLAKIS